MSAAAIRKIAERLKSPYADKVYVAKEYTKADLICDLERIADERAGA